MNGWELAALSPVRPDSAVAIVAIVLGAYCIGAIPWSYLIVRLITGGDVRTVGSGNAGATNVLRAAGKRAGLLALLLDAAKGVAAVLAARALGAPDAIVGAAAVAAVLGHVFPIFLGFRGGKGVATGAGAVASLSPLAGLLTVMVFLGVVLTTRFVSLGSMVAAGSAPVWMWVVGNVWNPYPPSRAMVASAALIALVIVVKHHTNVRRLLTGSERRVGDRRRDAPRDPEESAR